MDLGQFLGAALAASLQRFSLYPDRDRDRAPVAPAGGMD